MFRVTRRFEFDAAHRLLGYDGKCKHVHGHHYVAEVTVEGTKLDELGMLLDFGALKKVGDWIDGNWDHNILLHPDDHPMVDNWVSWNCLREPFTSCHQPTAENMAAHLFHKAKAILGGLVVNIRLYETPDCWVDYHE